MLRVSVVVPARNEQPRIGACLQALVEQDYPQGAYEVIVVDDGSTDRTAEEAARFGVSVLRQPALGGAAARNLGVAHARGEVVAFTDADCVPARDWLRELVAPFADKGVGVCGGDVQGLGASWVARYVDDEARPFRVDQLERTRPWPVFVTANVAYRREVFEQLGGFSVGLAGASDLEMAWRVARDGRYRLVGCGRAVVYHLHPTTVRGLYEQWFRWGAGRAQVDGIVFGCKGKVRGALQHTALALTSAAVAPLRVLARLVRGHSRARCAAPLLDVVRAWAFVAGYWAALTRNVGTGSWRERAREGGKVQAWPGPGAGPEGRG